MAEEHSAILREHVGSSGDGRAPVDGGPAVRGGALDGAGLDAGCETTAGARRAGWVATALSVWLPRPGRGSLGDMTTSPNLYRGFRFPAEVIEQAV